jgi:hypothetical protein
MYVFGKWEIIKNTIWQFEAAGRTQIIKLVSLQPINLHLVFRLLRLYMKLMCKGITI